MYIGIIADIIDSRELSNRLEVQESLNKTLSVINQMYDESIASKFVITLGDEFQGLLKSGNHLFDMIETIKLMMYQSNLDLALA